MKTSHFKFTNQQRNGIVLLVLVIILIQGYYYFKINKPVENEKIAALLKSHRSEIDSLRQAKLQAKSTYKIYPFNPNFITDYKGYTLGMSIDEIDRLHDFRNQDKWINSAEQFQEVTKISDSLLAEISPYFKFPSWVNNINVKAKFSNSSYSREPKTFDEKLDLNKATSSQLQKIYGIGNTLSKRIVNYRDKFKGGFASIVELEEVYGLTDEVIERLKEEFALKTPRSIKKINLNTATRDELVKIKYIDYELAKYIIEARTLRDGFKNLEELTKVKDFPIHKKELIQLYLYL